MNMDELEEFMDVNDIPGDFDVPTNAKDSYNVETYSLGPDPAEQECCPEESENTNSNYDFRGGKKFNPHMGGHEHPEAKAPQAMRPTNSKTGAVNTGAKGVKADYDEAKFNAEKLLKMDTARQGRKLERLTEGDNSELLRTIADTGNKAHQDKIRKVFEQQYKDPYDDDSSDLSGMSDSDDEKIFAEYKKNQLALIKNSVPVFGMYERQSKKEMANTIHKVHELCYVVVHIYENHLDACVKLHLCFEHISKIFDHVLFFRVRSTDIDPAYNQTRLPSLLIYRAGEMQEGLVRVDGLLRGQLSDQDVVKFLTAKGVLKSATMEVKQKQLARLKAERANVETDY